MTFKPDHKEDLSHHIRNATMGLSKHIKKIPDIATRLEAKKQLLRIELALIQYEGRLRQNALSPEKPRSPES
jgi:hypothetical protein